jgi:hypothetical protein
VGEGTLAARAEVLAARGALDEELERLEAAGRAAVDIPAKVRRNPVRTAGIAAGAGFLLVGGPKRLFRGVRRAVMGPPDPLPASMLPEEIERAVKALGEDGEKVRGTLEREFASYLDVTAKDRKGRDLSGMMALVLATFGKPVAQRIGRLVAEELANPDREGYEAQLAKLRARRGTPPPPPPPSGA